MQNNAEKEMSLFEKIEMQHAIDLRNKELQAKYNNISTNNIEADTLIKNLASTCNESVKGINKLILHLVESNTKAIVIKK